MRGEVFAVTGPAFANWLGGSAATTRDQASMAAEGKALFMRLGCAGCHGEGAKAPAAP
jgi:mono/diheme cytochrome c family protein